MSRPRTGVLGRSGHGGRHLGGTQRFGLGMATVREQHCYRALEAHRERTNATGKLRVHACHGPYMIQGLRR